LELEKLPQLIELRLDRLATLELDPAAATKLEAEIAQLQQQIARHQKNLDAIDTRAGLGFVAAELDPDSFGFSETAAKKLELFASRLKQLPNNDPAVSAQGLEIQTIETRRQQLSQKEETIEAQYLDDKISLETYNASISEIKPEKQQLIKDLKNLEQRLFIILGEKLESNKSGLGKDGFKEYKKWYREVRDTEELIEFSPQLKNQYSDKIGGQKATWLSVLEEAKSNNKYLASIIKEERLDLIELRNEIIPKLIEQRQQRIDDLKSIIENLHEPLDEQISSLMNKNRRLSYDLARVEVYKRSENSEITTKIRELNFEKKRLEKEQNDLEIFQQKTEGKKEIEKFADNAKVNDVWARLTKDRDGEKTSSRKWADVLIREGIVSSERDLINYIEKNIRFQGRSVDNVRRDFKNYYRPQLLNLIYSQSTPELRYKKMREIGESLDVQGQGSISEDWYQREFASKRGVANTTQATIDVEVAKGKYDIELTSSDNRRFDELYGDENNATIREHKHVTGKLGPEQILQFQDNIKIVQHNQSIDTKTANGISLDKIPQDTPVILEKDSKKFRPTEVVYTFATPEGVKANANFMAAQLTEPNNINILSFEIINNKGQKKTIDFDNISELDEPVLSQWLYP
ncbi:MAG: hypothetical protein ACFBSE_14010, partial [Prochloraceae cyanobacterium]